MKLTHEQIREKYFNILHTQGMDAAVTALHREIGNKLEQKVFDGGYKEERLAEVQFLRELARDLYSHKLVEGSKKYYQGE